MTCSQTSLGCWVFADWRTRQGPWFLPEESARYFSIFIKKNLQVFTLLQNCDSWFTIYVAGFTYFWQFYHVLDAAKYLFSSVKLLWWKSPCFLITDALRSGFSTSALLTFWLRWFFVGRGCPVHGRILSSSPGLYPNAHYENPCLQIMLSVP